jgi:hypothetical protein
MDGMKPTRTVGTCLALAALLLCRPPLAAAEPQPRIIEAKSPEAAKEFFASRGKTVVTLLGFSGAGYEDPEAMLAAAKKALQRFDPEKTIVNIGATESGIGAVYELARSLGFETTGIVSSLAQEEKVPLSPHVQTVIFLQDKTWGGLVAGTQRLSPTSQAMISCSDHLIAIGGGPVARDELLAAQRLGKRVEYLPADMNHQAALEKARKQGLPAPTSFRGAVDEAFGKTDVHDRP